MTHSLSIHVATPPDVPEIARKVAEANIATYAFVTPSITPDVLRQHFGSPEWEDDKERRLLENMARGGKMYIGRCACTGGGVVGYAAVLEHWPGGSLGVDEEHQGGSLALATNLVWHQFEGDYPKPDKFWVVPGTAAIRMYKNLGLEPQGEVEKGECPMLGDSKVILPQMKFVATREDRERIRARLERVLSARGLLIPVSSPTSNS